MSDQDRKLIENAAAALCAVAKANQVTCPVVLCDQGFFTAVCHAIPYNYATHPKLLGKAEREINGVTFKLGTIQKGEIIVQY